MNDVFSLIAQSLLYFQIFDGCGTPRWASRQKRSSESYEEYAYGKDFLSFTRGGAGSSETQVTAAGTNLDKLVRDIKAKVRSCNVCYFLLCKIFGSFFY